MILLIPNTHLKSMNFIQKPIWLITYFIVVWLKAVRGITCIYTLNCFFLLFYFDCVMSFGYFSFVGIFKYLFIIVYNFTNICWYMSQFINANSVTIIKILILEKKEKMVYDSDIFIRAIHLKYPKLEIKAISVPICNRMIIFFGGGWVGGLCFWSILSFSHLNFWSNWDNFKILIRIFHSFLYKKTKNKTSKSWSMNCFHSNS